MGTFTYNEAHIAANNTDYVSAVRFLVSDTDSTDYDLSDEVIAALYNQTTTTNTQIIRNYQTAIMAQEYLCNKSNNGIKSFSSGGTSVTYGGETDCSSKLQNLRMKLAQYQGVSAVIYPSRSTGFTW